MAELKIEGENILLPLYKHRSKIRISDKNGNHISKIVDCLIIKELYIEWMITNQEIKELIYSFLNSKDKETLVVEIQKISNFIRSSDLAKRQALKSRLLENFAEFKVYEYIETYYSYERTYENGIMNKIVFKMGDFTLAPFFFILIPFDNSNLILQNKKNRYLQINDKLGNGSRGIWKIKKTDIVNLIKTISNASDSHKNDMINLLNSNPITF